jgi:hypothetical protein
VIGQRRDQRVAVVQVEVHRLADARHPVRQVQHRRQRSVDRRLDLVDGGRKQVGFGLQAGERQVGP